ncbi:NAD(P)H-dependent oxidoreductase subunit E [Sedimentisphaera salicampi]|uniref:NADH:ubiquinone oxidoreductase 24 kD subunit n=1 Tax=Sedimentisphaera salicampi TaxID=1941349 RepID=A0A1W6LL14_9BACT|nr:NAD(P)H-dependent oxidoreductase subunit E [Sedimentisphaera salicampi]ARN56461.1 NADH:ubiquinone oxidoreductase 24 kD subunit [Sedimentisphaera salicampi]OXU15347.1 NADH:ubiquinone oxidoreductase 24 kD subunit [Sedimentisphaera salicampi]
MKKITVEICTGTTCHVMGSEAIMEIRNMLSERYKESVEIKATSCLGFCRERQAGEAPFVKVNGRIVPEASLLKVTQMIDEIERGN